MTAETNINNLSSVEQNGDLMSNGTTKTKTKRIKQPLKCVRPGLYRRGNKLYARVWVNGKRTYRSTGTATPSVADKVLTKFQNDETLRQNGHEPDVAALERKKLTVGKVLDHYVAKGFPDQRMRCKKPTTITNERKCLARLRPFFDTKFASSLTLGDCDGYRDWRTSGGFKYVRNGKSVGRHVGNRVVDIELQVLSVALDFTVRRGFLRSNPIAKRNRYHSEEDTRHCREVAPTPEQLKFLATAFREKKLDVVADCLLFLGFSGLRVNEALPLKWDAVDWKNGIIHVQREKRGINPWVPILPEMEPLLKMMKARSTSDYLFPSPNSPEKPMAYPTVAHQLRNFCRTKKTKYITLHGHRSFFVTQCRQYGLTDAVIASLIGDKSGPAIIAQTYGDVRDDHLMEQAKRVRMLAGLGSSTEPDATAVAA